MSTTPSGVDFLRDWVRKNVTPNDSNELRATILTTQCVLEAATKGIMVAHMEEAGRTVESVILDAMQQLSESGIRGD